jgi:hypothetical protein
MYSRLFKGEISDAVCGHFDNFNDCLSDLYRKLTEHFRPGLFDDSGNVDVLFVQDD